jgi:lipopolysaccharide transport system ATP-binding protein
VENLSKRYHLGQIGAATLRESARRFFSRTQGKTIDLGLTSTPQQPGNLTTDPNDLWALRDVSFEVQPGEVLGVIGRNGAGKSTLLKILSRITEPTSGRAVMRGRVASLLEVGTGFHPELTGRENIFLNGAILGMRKAEIARKFDEIVAFSEVEKFIDTPVKRYSSGMYVRLAFAVAAHLEPEILIVDEVLAVGDASFQKRCLGKMREVAQGGRTVLFVSHNMTAIENLCNRVIVMRNGMASNVGSVAQGLNDYLAQITTSQSGQADLCAHPGRAIGMKVILISVAILRDHQDQSLVGIVRTGEDLIVEIGYDAGDEAFDYIALGVCTQMGVRVLTTGTYLSPDCSLVLTGRGKVKCRMPNIPLVEGHYSLLLAVGRRQPLRNMDCIENALSFQVLNGDYFGTGLAPLSGQGVIAQRSSWEKE